MCVCVCVCVVFVNLQLGSQGDLGAHHVALLRGVPPRQDLQGLVSEKNRRGFSQRLRHRLDLLRRRQPLWCRAPQLRVLLQVKRATAEASKSRGGT